jgi:Tol biopolymer transport system component
MENNIDYDVQQVNALQGIIPQRQVISFASDRNGNFEVFIIKSNGSQETQITEVPFYNARPHWSSDGEKIIFTSVRNPELNGEIYMMNPDGTEQTNLTNHPARSVGAPFPKFVLPF